jgi:signal transduction histidine kinase
VRTTSDPARENGGVQTPDLTTRPGESQAWLATLARRWAAAPGTSVVWAAVLAAGAMIEVLLRNPSDSHLQVPLLLAALGTVPVAFARRLPVSSALVIIAATLVIISRRTFTDPVTLALTASLPVGVVLAVMTTAYLVGAHRSAVPAAVVVGPYLILAISQPWSSGTSGRIGMVVLLGLVFGAVATGRAWRSRAAAATHEATQRALAGTRLENVERGERARIARELHDVVAHHISMISVQAETARLTTPGLPAEGARALRAIGDTARTALTEMRRLLGVLRDDAGAQADRSPQPGLRQLTELVDEARGSTGATVRLVVRGAVEPLDPGVELVAYRIVQEALTNARRHAPDAAVDVELDYGTDALQVLVRDNGPGPAPDARPGHGILGMRERATMLGGTLSTGAAPGGGYLVQAVLPRQAAG